MCTRPALRAPPLRLPALRALPPLMLMMRPQPAVFMKGMTAREQRSAPTYFTLKSTIKSSSITVSIGPVAVAEPPGADPLLTRMCTPPSCCAASATIRSTCSLLVTSAARGTIRRFVSAASSRAVASRSALFRATIASHDRMLVPQSEVHGILSLVGVVAILRLHCSLFSLKQPGARVVQSTDLRRGARERARCAVSGHWHRRPPLLSEDSRLTAFSDRDVMFSWFKCGDHADHVKNKGRQINMCPKTRRLFRYLVSAFGLGAVIGWSSPSDAYIQQ